ncbi:MAG: BamA/TamA family outer membrane protein [Gemmatimonadales bacterium]
MKDHWDNPGSTGATARRAVRPSDRRIATLGILLFLFALPLPALAQDSVIVIDPDARLADSLEQGGPSAEFLRRLVDRFNATGTTRFWGDVDIPADAGLRGAIAVFRGSVRLAGRIDGSLLVINGSAAVLNGAEVTGDVMVIGGGLSVFPGGRVGGRQDVFLDAIPVSRAADGRLVVRQRRQLPDLSAARKRFESGPFSTTLLLGTDRTYNRIEGLPIIFGPGFEYRFSPGLSARLDLHGILRTATDVDALREDFGYMARAELRFQGLPGGGLGFRAYNQVRSIEDQPLSRSEVGWSAFLFQRDQRDYYLSQGVGSYLYFYPERSIRLEAGLRRDEESSVRANDPWSLFRNSDRWRPNPLIDDGHFTVAHFAVEVDSRNDPDFPTDGWYLQGRVERNWSNDVAPVTLPTGVRGRLPGTGYAFNTVSFDLRRYSRLSANYRLNLRLYGSGYAGGDPLPVQRRVSLGGSDLLPGYAFRASTCLPAGAGDPASAALCDRLLVAQAEFRARLNVGVGFHFREREGAPERFIGIDQADFVVFTDAGKAWLSGDGPGRVPDNRIPAFKEWKADAGVGLDLGNLAVYLARALTDGEPLRLAFRIKRRF